MNKVFKIFTLLLVLTAFMAIGCTPDKPTQDSSSVGGSYSDSSDVPTIVVESLVEGINLKDIEVLTHDYTQYFTITENDKNVTVKSNNLDVSNLSETAGEYVVICFYGGIEAQITVTVIETVYEITLLQNEIEVNKTLALTYDYLSLFTASIDGKSIDITSDMVESTVKAEVGKYAVTVTNGKVSKTLKVIVNNEHEILVVITYPNFEIPQNLISDYDFTNLFSMYIDGKYHAVTNEMIDISSLENVEIGKSYSVILNYLYDNSEISKTATVTVVENQETVINAKNIITYPNSRYIDITTLFEIKKGDEIIPVTNEMLSGSIDYSTVGINEITLTYEGQTAVATVEVKLGVIIQYATSDTIMVKKGTDKQTYAFANDFVLLVNGIEFIGFESYIDTSNVNFDIEGSYTASLVIPYNDKKIGLSGVNFDYISKDITYVVVSNEYTYNVINPMVTLAQGTTSYNAYSNVKLTINGRNQSFTENKEYVDIITCYYEIIKPIDFSSKAIQEITLALYVNGVNAAPIYVSYELLIESNVEIKAIDTLVYTGETLYTADLFEIVEDGNNVNVTYDMLRGKVDTLKAGMYFVTATYQGVKAQAKVVVMDNAIKGNYSTMLHTIAETSSDYDEEYGDTAQPTRRLGDLIINQNGGIRVLGSDCTIIGVVNENTLRLRIKSYDYTLYYFNGIIVLDPDNEIKLTYNADKRPLIYFHKDVWDVEERVVINQYSTYVLNAISSCYSIDAFKLTEKATGNSLWYALKVNLVEKISSDTIYTIEWGEITFNEDFTMQADAVNYFTFDGVTERFIMADRTQGQVNSVSEEKTFANKIFYGTINGKSAQLIVDSYEGFSLKIDNELVFKAGSYEIAQMSNGYVDHKNNEVFLYDVDESVYSYKFKLDVENSSFTTIEKDKYYGLYEIESMYIFLDGYEKGIVNFNTNSFYKHQFVYSAIGNKIDLKYINTKPSFTHGTNATLFMDDFGNVLTASYFKDEKLIGKRFENSIMTDGIIVEVNSYQVGADSDKIAKVNLLNNISIRNASGELSYEEKTEYVKTNLVRFNTPGFYKFTISAIVNGESVEVPYTVQVLDAVYDGHPVVATYGAGIIFSSNSLMINKYGQAIIKIDDLIFNGNVKIFDNNNFIIDAQNGAKTVRIDATFIETGLISVRCTGYKNFSDYYTTGSLSVMGTNSCVLRIISLASGNVFINSPTITAMGTIVSVEVVSGTLGTTGSILKISEGQKETFVKILKNGDFNEGLQIADAYRGEFTCSDGKTFTLDGFGKIVLNGEVGSYKLVDNVATVYLSNSVAIYRLNNTTHEATKVDIAIDNTLIQGKTYSATYNFIADNYLYSATTDFIFGENGIVTAISVSDEYAENSYDLYSPPFASEIGVKGTYFVNGDIVTIKINGYVFTFRINFLLRPDVLTTVSTTLDSDAHGHFTEGTIFSVK